MRIRATHSHMHGEEFLYVHKPNLWIELQDAIDKSRFMPIEASLSTVELAALGEIGTPAASNDNFAEELRTRGWAEYGDHLTLIRERVAVEWQTGSFSSVSSNSYANLLGLFLTDVIDVGIRIHSLHNLQARESESFSGASPDMFSCVLPHRAFPPVPLVLVAATL
ncbi:MAG: hypothetical protein F4058_02330 [Rhodothermaceae bacterium]|nr:hypothetical protein [Gammaproteobacteria bacterium]MYH85741.1 hypothetical protein [Gammaproteobacteria bacterium]MYI84150.1 hypothetical protein [Rhodothermaceae bacterium]